MTPHLLPHGGLEWVGNVAWLIGFWAMHFIPRLGVADSEEA